MHLCFLTCLFFFFGLCLLWKNNDIRESGTETGTENLAAENDEFTRPCEQQIAGSLAWGTTPSLSSGDMLPSKLSFVWRERIPRNMFYVNMTICRQMEMRVFTKKERWAQLNEWESKPFTVNQYQADEIMWVLGKLTCLKISKDHKVPTETVMFLWLPKVPLFFNAFGWHGWQ